MSDAMIEREARVLDVIRNARYGKSVRDIAGELTGERRPDAHACRSVSVVVASLVDAKLVVAVRDTRPVLYRVTP